MIYYFIVSNRAGDVHVELVVIISTCNRLISLYYLRIYHVYKS